ncbi:MAG: UPF0280 family protein [Actinomycetota bacterium]|nr:UPF0280 family protein [Actinomycetota bacterium]
MLYHSDMESDRFKISVEKLFTDKLDQDKNVYRNRIKYKERYNWRITYKYSDLLVSCNKDVSLRLEKLIKEIYDLLESCIKRESDFEKSLVPLKIKEYYPPIVRRMCRKAAIFNVGPMATVAGAVCDYIASGLDSYCRRLIIENGGDIFIKSNRDINIGVYLKNKYFADKIYLKIKAGDTPCGICSSSGIFGHSLSLGKSDLVVVLAKSTISADGAATSIANKINTPADVDKAIIDYKNKKDIKGILVIKDDKLGVWGNIELIGN